MVMSIMMKMTMMMITMMKITMMMTLMTSNLCDYTSDVMNHSDNES